MLELQEFDFFCQKKNIDFLDFEAFWCNRPSDLLQFEVDSTSNNINSKVLEP